jgi:hypothetical protein
VGELGLQVLKAEQRLLSFGEVADEAGENPPLTKPRFPDGELDRIEANPKLAAGLARLPGRKFVFTNGDAPYARRVLEAIGSGLCLTVTLRPAGAPLQRAAFQCRAQKAEFSV